jgi:hypothetical protein
LSQPWHVGRTAKSGDHEKISASRQRRYGPRL